MKHFFITGTDTDIGKTFVACALMIALREHGIKVAPMKPVSAGTVLKNGILLNEDVHHLMDVYGSAIDSTLVGPYCFRQPVAPHIAAEYEAAAVDHNVIERAFTLLAQSHDTVLVEGAGGFLVPLSSTESMSVLPSRLGLDVILVVGMRLGCLNHALLTAEAIRTRGLHLAGWVANTVDPAMPYLTENIDTLKHLLAAPCLGVVPRLPPILAKDQMMATAHHASTYLQIEPLFA
ncbi:MAG: dethiobiotin synthase [Pseudomonadota bacterium]